MPVKLTKHWLRIPKKMRHSLSIRIFHWLLTLSVFLLISSGLYISKPNYRLFANMRRAKCYHFISQILFIGSVAWRIYHGVKTKSYRDIIPGRRDLAALWPMVRFETFFTSATPSFQKYNPLQKLLYSSWLPAFFIQSATGLVLLAPNLFSRLEGYLGGLGNARKIHFLNTLYLVSTIMGHIYFSLIAGKNILKSMITGYE